MDPIVAAAVLAGALLHATWHALVKISGDQVSALAGMNLVSGTAGALLLPFVSLPSAKASAVIGISVLLHLGYKVALARLYSRAELSVAYPVARGLTPALAAVFAFAFMGERPTLLAAGGIVAISLGIVGAAAGHAAAPMRMSRPTVVAALAAGTTVAAYSAVDAYGVRIDDDWIGFTAWLVVADSVAFVGFALATRGRAAPAVWRRHWARTVLSGLLGTVSFGVFLWALGRAQVGPVAALRETSIVFAALIGMLFLRERLTVHRTAATGLVMAGAAAIALAR